MWSDYGAWPSGKALDSGSRDRRFESYRPSQTGQQILRPGSMTGFFVAIFFLTNMQLFFKTVLSMAT